MRKLFNQLYLIRLPSITALWWHHRDVIKTTVSFQWYCSFVKYLIQYILTWYTDYRDMFGFFFLSSVCDWEKQLTAQRRRHRGKKKHVSKTGSADSGLGRYSRVPPQRHGYGNRDSRRDGAWRSPSRPGESCCLWLSRFTTRGINLGLQKSPLTPPPPSPPFLR